MQEWKPSLPERADRKSEQLLRGNPDDPRAEKEEKFIQVTSSVLRCGGRCYPAIPKSGDNELCHRGQCDRQRQCRAEKAMVLQAHVTSQSGLTSATLRKQKSWPIRQGHHQLSREISHYIWFGLNEGHNEEVFSWIWKALKFVPISHWSNGFSANEEY